ncbi:MAG: C25 family cysteine peptidase, partial [Candidatus Krumholzibacteriia bacterium]
MIHAPVPSHERARRRVARRRRPAAVIPAVAAILVLGAAVRLPGQPAVEAPVAPVSAPAPDGGRSVRVERSNDAGLVLAFSAGDTAWSATAAPDGGAPLWELRLPGFSGHGATAQPVTPVWGAWIVVPPGMRPVVAPLTERWDTVPPRRLLVGPTPVALRDPESGQEDLGAELLLPGEMPRRGRPLPAAAQAARSTARAAAEVPSGPAPLTVGEPLVWRGRRIASVTLAPLAADGEGLAARLLREGRWEIRFVAAAKGDGAGAAGARSGRGDDRFGFLFLNPEALSRWPAETSVRTGAAPVVAAGTAAARRAVVPLAPEVQLLVPKTQLYRLTAARLRQLGWLPAGGVREDQIRLYQRRYNAADPAHYLEIEVPIRLLGNGGDFSDGEALLFYALRARDDNAWTDDAGGVPVEVPGCGDPNELDNGPSGASDPGLRTGNVYWLAFADAPGEAPWARMAEATLPPSAGAPPARYRRVDYLEEDSGYQEATFDAASDRNHYNRYTDTAATVTVPLWSPDPAGTDGRVRAGLIGWNISPNPRLVRASLVCGSNTVGLGDFNLNNLNNVEAASGDTIGGGLLASPSATLRIDSLNSPPTSLYAFLDWVEIAYDALYRAVNDALTFPGDAVAGARDLEVTGFSRADLGVVDITDPRRPVWIALGAGNVVSAGGSYTLSLQAVQPDGSPRRFIALADMAGAGVPEFTTYNSRRIVSPADPTVASGAPSVLVVTHGAFRAALQPWLDYRRSAAGGGHSLQVVDVQDVYDWFSGGLKDPWAIRRFCEYAMDRWGSWGLLLVGDANENARALNVTDGIYDWLPTHLHAQYVLNPPEVLASDKWYATPAADATFPTGTSSPAEMIVGRFPCNSEAELATMIAKTLQAEADQAGQAWRHRAIFVADDDFSYGWGDVALSQLTRDPLEQRFRVVEDSLAVRWGRFDDGAQTPSREFLSTYLDPLFPPNDTVRGLTLTRDYTKSTAVPPLLANLSQGALLVHYQGHANGQLLCHELLFWDERATPSIYVRQDVASLTNTARPWVFVGLGCHISDWIQNTADYSAPELSSLGEKLLTQPGGGACATYASSGFEFLLSNADFAELQLANWTDTPPRPFGGGRTTWRLGDLFLAGEAAVLARYTSPYDTEYRAMAAQYCLLGDPLLVLDCGPPAIAAVFTDAGDAPVTEGMAVTALDTTNVRRLRLTAVDEAGIARLVVLDSAGNDLSAAVTELPPVDPASDQRATYEIALPVRPFDHEVTLHVYDTSDRLPTDNHATLTVRMPLTAAVFLAGSPAPLEPGAVRFAAGVPLDFTAVVATPAYVPAGAVLQLTGDGLTLSNVRLVRRDGRTLDLAFTAVAPDAAVAPRAVTLIVAGYPTTFVLQEGEAPLGSYTLGEVLAFPNPAPGAVRILFRTTAPASPGRLVIY